MWPFLNENGWGWGFEARQLPMCKLVTHYCVHSRCARVQLPVLHGLVCDSYKSFT